MVSLLLGDMGWDNITLLLSVKDETLCIVKTYCQGLVIIMHGWNNMDIFVLFFGEIEPWSRYY